MKGGAMDKKTTMKLRKCQTCGEEHMTNAKGIKSHATRCAEDRRIAKEAYEAGLKVRR